MKKNYSEPKIKVHSVALETNLLQDSIVVGGKTEPGTEIEVKGNENLLDGLFD